MILEIPKDRVNALTNENLEKLKDFIADIRPDYPNEILLEMLSTAYGGERKLARYIAQKKLFDTFFMTLKYDLAMK
ncbi:hypothetical protein CCR75_007542 [Bremia lactucae]|uniref:Uncharacterized protein n=1 Tax=Bremia lactucae TaxID=4779 RepID=A0A976FHF3_BRELC|nr:hypothetical protein CCR75_007542 [Bremia lactucae]